LSVSPCFHCYTVGGTITHLKEFWITQKKKHQKQAITYVSRCKCKITHYSKHQQPNVSEWNADPGGGLGLWSFRCVDGRDILHLCFHHRSESEKCHFLSFLFKITYQHSSVNKKRMHEARIKVFCLFKSRCSVLFFHILHAQIFIQQNILGAMKVLWKCWQWLATCFKNASGGKSQSLQKRFLEHSVSEILDLRTISLNVMRMYIKYTSDKNVP